MSKTIVALSEAVLICASSQFASADESGAITGAVGGAVVGAVVGGPVGAVVGGAAIGNSIANQSTIIAATLIIPIITTTINTEKSPTSGARTLSRSRICGSKSTASIVLACGRSPI